MDPPLLRALSAPYTKLSPFTLTSSCLTPIRVVAEEIWSQVFKGTERFLAEMGKECKTGSLQARELCTTPRSQLLLLGSSQKD